MTYIQIKNKILDTARNAGIKLTGDLMYNLPYFVNEIQRKICSKKNYWFMRNKSTCDTIIGQQLYSIVAVLPALGFSLPRYKDAKMLFYTEDDERNEIDDISYSDAIKTYNDNDTGAPESYTLEDDVPSDISIWPVPDRVVTMTFLVYQFLADLALDADTNTITLEAPELLINGALMELFSFKNMEAKYNEFLAKYEKDLKELNARDMKKRLPEELSLIPRADNLASGIAPTINRLWDEWY